MVAALGQLMYRLEADPAVTVLVFGDAVEDFVNADFDRCVATTWPPIRVPAWPSGPTSHLLDKPTPNSRQAGQCWWPTTRTREPINLERRPLPGYSGRSGGSGIPRHADPYAARPKARVRRQVAPRGVVCGS